jgi:hypothetical protein
MLAQNFQPKIYKEGSTSSNFSSSIPTTLLLLSNAGRSLPSPYIIMHASQYLLLLLTFVVSCVLAAPAADLQRRSGYSGDGTFYTVGLGSCGKTNSDSQMVAALNAPQMGNNKYCGKTATVTGPKGEVTVTIVDTCPECSSGDLDLSPAAFDKIGSESAGRIKITWNWS